MLFKCDLHFSIHCILTISSYSNRNSLWIALYMSLYDDDNKLFSHVILWDILIIAKITHL